MAKRPKRSEPTARQHSDQMRRARELRRLNAAVAERSVSGDETKPGTASAAVAKTSKSTNRK